MKPMMESGLISLLVLMMSLSRATHGSDIAGSSTDSSPYTVGNQTVDTLVNRTINRTTQTVYRTFPRNFNFTNLAQNTSALPNRTDASFTSAVEAFMVEVDPSEGDSVTLSCIVYDPSIVTVSWYKDQRLTLHDILYPAADKHRMSISHSVEDDHRRVFNLTIDFLHSSDSGEYTCRAYYRPDAVAAVELVVTHNPELHIPECTLNGRRQITVTEGDTLNLECRLQNPGSQWHSLWIRQHSSKFNVFTVPSSEEDSNMIMSAHSEVASRDLNGTTFVCSFVCFADDCPSSSSESCSIGPLVINPLPPTEPPPLIAIDPGIQIAVEGDDVEFSCSTSFPDSNAVWFPVGEEPPEDHILVSGDGSQLSIKNVRENDTELVACGVFCQDRLIAVGQVDLKVIHKDDPSIETTTAEITSATITATTTTVASTPSTATTLSNIVKSTTISNKIDTISDSKEDPGDTNQINTISRRTSKQSVQIGIPITVFILVVLAIFVLVFIRKRNKKYLPAATQEPVSNLPV